MVGCLKISLFSQFGTIGTTELKVHLMTKLQELQSQEGFSKKIAHKVLDLKVNMYNRLYVA